MTNTRITEIRHFHLFCGLGGGARGFNRGQATVAGTTARFRCIGGIDSNPAAIRDFHRLSGVPGTCLDLFDRDQYITFHGCEPPEDWREATPEDLHRAAGHMRPHIVFTSPPCKGFSGLLSEQRSQNDKYQALNGLTLRGVWLALEAWQDDPPEFFILENVPRIQSRGRCFLDKIRGLLESYGYAVAETTHDCGEIGGLAQRRKRFLLVARHQEKVPPGLYEPPVRALRTVGELLERLPLPGDERAGPMHRLPRLQWRTWVRLAFVEAGGDWRSLTGLAVENDYLRDYLILPEHYGYRDVLGVVPWTHPTGTVTGRGTPTNGCFSVADPRFCGHEYAQYGILRWSDTAGAVSGQSAPGGGRYSVADPRTGLDPSRAAYRTAGHYGVVRWAGRTGAVTGAGKHDSGSWSVADPRLVPTLPDTADDHRLPAPTERTSAVIRALDGTWHRPFTTLELAALQGLLDPDEHLELAGLSNSAWRERIGNAVPPPAAEAIASVMARALLLAGAGETFVLDAMPLWVRPVAASLSIDVPCSHTNQ